MKDNLNSLSELIDLKNSIDVLITDKNGHIIKTQSNFEEMYGCKREYVLGKSVKQLEQEGIFYPSATAKVLETGEEVTIIQKSKNGNTLISVGVPIKNSKNQITQIVNYTTNLEQYLSIKKWSDEINNKIDYYNIKINEVEKVKDKIDYIASFNLKSKKEKDKEEDFTKTIMGDLVTQNKTIENIINLIKKVSKFEVNVLLLGETGVGKTKIAKKTHLIGNNAGEFIEVNCGAIPNELIESELFGYEKGSFTGAKK